MTFDQIITTTKNSVTEDDRFELEKEFDFWKPFNYNKIKWKSTTTNIPILCSFVNEEKEVVVDQNIIQKFLVPNKDISVPTEEQKNAIIYLFENEFPLGQIVIDYIFNEYNTLREYYKEPDDSDFMPKFNNSNELTEQIELTQIYILSNSNAGIAFIGFYFACGWDDEHGIGLLTHRNKVLQFGQIEEASDEYFKIRQVML